jgi:hypothetical protein
VDVAAVADAVALEGSVGGRRADVLLHLRGRPAVAVEVRVAHAVEAEKGDDLGALGVPVAEVDAGGDWERRDGEVALIACAWATGFPPCPACATMARTEAGRTAGGEAADLAELEGYRARGLLGPPPGRPVPDDLRITHRDHERLDREFRCPECGGTSLLHGQRIVRHACPTSDPRAVAWRGYDGVLVEMGWWRSAR